MNYSISISGYQDQTSEDEAKSFTTTLEGLVKQFVGSLPGVVAASVSTDRDRVIDAKGA